MLEGMNIRLKIRDKEDMDFWGELWNDLDYYGDYEPIEAQLSKTEIERFFDNPPPSITLTEWTLYAIEKKDGTKIGYVTHYLIKPTGVIEISYALKSSERGKGYATEAVQIMADYLFLSKNIVRIQATTHVKNKASQRVLEKNGFQKEGKLRKLVHVRGEWTGHFVYSILREEWKEPKILTKTISKLETYCSERRVEV